jgi:hypothetical protein
VLEGLCVQQAAIAIAGEQHAEEQHLGGQKDPHAQGGRLALLRGIVELFCQAGRGAVHASS